MARDPNDMTGEHARSAGETAGAQRARQRALEGDAAPSAHDIGEAVAKAMARQAAQPDRPQVLGDVVRASVRAGVEQTRVTSSDGSNRIVVSPKALTFKANETLDGREATVMSGKPVRLPRATFERYRDAGLVVLAE